MRSSCNARGIKDFLSATTRIAGKIYVWHGNSNMFLNI
jgi:hypothetical protein